MFLLNLCDNLFSIQYFAKISTISIISITKKIYKKWFKFLSKELPLCMKNSPNWRLRVIARHNFFLSFSVWFANKAIGLESFFVATKFHLALIYGLQNQLDIYLIIVKMAISIYSIFKFPLLGLNTVVIFSI